MSQSLKNSLEQGLIELGIQLDEEKVKKLLDYLSLLQKWNKVYNLTAIRDPQEMVALHILDSLAVVPYLWGKRWLDVGTGAGIPGVILAIVYPEWSFSLLDSNSKKTSFIKQAVIELGMKNVQVICDRVEKFQEADPFDGIISRAYADTSDFVCSTKHLMSKEGKWAAMKGSPEQELQDLPVDIQVERIIPLRIPGLNASRCLVILKANK